MNATVAPPLRVTVAGELVAVQDCHSTVTMNGARFVHDTLERLGWDVEIADAAKARGLAPLAAKTDKID
ncbi:MAG: hypothetical protein ABSG37_13575, partial [Candidatus Limnocylindrales bacterium]